MAKSKYQNFEQYAENNARYLVKCLTNETHKTQSKIEFLDGSYYSVTKSGARQWGYGRYYRHRETGPSCIWIDYCGCTYPTFALYDVGFKTQDDWEEALARLGELRALTNDKLESIVEHVAMNSSWGDKHNIWKSVLSKHENPNEMLAKLTKISESYKTAKETLDAFVKETEKATEVAENEEGSTNLVTS